MDPRPVQFDAPTIGALESLIRDIPDFPKPGILFKDITPLLADPAAFELRSWKKSAPSLRLAERARLWGGSSVSRPRWTPTCDSSTMHHELDDSGHIGL